MEATTIITGVVTDDERRLLTVEWSLPFTGVIKCRQYPYAWLRDCCPCTSCMHPSTLSRLLLMQNLDPHILPQQVQYGSENVNVVWADSSHHVSNYTSEWLVNKSFDIEEQALRQSFVARPMKLWGSELQDKLVQLDFNKIMTDDKTLHEWLVTLEEIGLALITGVPKEEGQLERLGERVSFLRPTHNGNVFNIKKKDKPSTLAGTSAPLGLHTDLAFYTNVPGVQLFHCIQQTLEGGDNEFSDGFHVAQQLRSEKPDEFKILSTVPIDHYDVGEVNSKKYYQHSKTPVFSLDSNREVVKINYNNQERDYTVSLPIEQVNSLYEALRIFDNFLYAPRNFISLKLNEGEVVSFANMRVLHGRRGFPPGTQRFMQGGYIDWEEIRSRRRVLDLELYPSDFSYIIAN